jgi:bifunctional non-homologous end joining protein LigD
MPTNTIKSITLYCQDHGSDKVYMLQLNKVEGGFMVYYGNGKRGASLKPKAITTSPVTFEEAEKIYASKEAAKRKGKRGVSIYTESPDGGDTLEVNENAGNHSGIEPQLLNEIDESQARKLCADPAWVAQEKHDGERRPVVVKNGVVSGINRRGEFTGGMKTEVAKGICTAKNMITDTEDLGAYLAAFDLLEYDGVDLTGLGTVDRFRRLESIANDSPALKISPMAVTTQEKTALLNRMIKEDREGIVFKRANAPYVGGRPCSGGDQLKFKLYDEASVVVMAINKQRSFKMKVIDANGNDVSVGNCTIPANQAIPAVGSIVEVKYLYAYPNGGSLYQPTFNKQRPDQTKNDCMQKQLKYKPQLAA